MHTCSQERVEMTMRRGLADLLAHSQPRNLSRKEVLFIY